MTHCEIPSVSCEYFTTVSYASYISSQPRQKEVQFLKTNNKDEMSGTFMKWSIIQNVSQIMISDSRRLLWISDISL